MRYAWKRVLAFLLIVLAVVGLVAGCAAPTGQRIHPFAIYLVSGIVDSRLTTSGVGDWSHVALSPSPLISEADILSYDFANHSMRLRPEAMARIPHPPVQGTAFVVVADGRRIYLGVFVTGVSSMSFAVPSIMVDRHWVFGDQEPDTLVIERAYPSPSFAAGPDPRSDDRIRQALSALRQSK